MKKMYNVIFPIFFLFLLPLSWIAILPANFLIDLCVFYISMRYLKMTDRKHFLFPTTWKIWGFGFLSDLIGCAVLFVVYLTGIRIPGVYPVLNGIAWNPYSNAVSFLLIAVSIFAAGYLIYFFNKKYSFQKTEMSEIQKHKIALYLAVFTAPYILLIPTMWLYNK